MYFLKSKEICNQKESTNIEAQLIFNFSKYDYYCFVSTKYVYTIYCCNISK